MKRKKPQPKTNRQLILQIAREFTKKVEAKTGCRHRRFNQIAVRWMEMMLIEERRSKRMMKWRSDYWRHELQEIVDTKFKP